jgi:hypothetical protein
VGAPGRLGAQQTLDGQLAGAAGARACVRGRRLQAGQEGLHLLIDLVAEAPHRVQVIITREVQPPVLLAGGTGRQGRPAARRLMVMTRSAVAKSSVVIGLG